MRDLLDNERMLNQIASLDRRLGRSGRDVVDDPPGLHDDVANTVRLAPSRWLRPKRRLSETMGLDFSDAPVRAGGPVSSHPTLPSNVRDVFLGKTTTAGGRQNQCCAILRHFRPEVVARIPAWQFSRCCVTYMEDWRSTAKRGRHDRSF
jgi:hypothetical protein